LPQPAAAEVDAAAVSLEQAFADLGAPSRAAAPIAGAVDVRAIEPAKPQPTIVLAKPEAKPEATGKPTAAEATDVDASVPATKKATTRQARLAEAKLAAAAKLAGAKSADSEEVAGKKGEAKAGSDKKANGKAVDPKKGDPKKGDPKKGTAKTADAKKAVPSHPSRIWVQVGVGRDKAAIAYDWRKFVKQDPALFKSRQPYISDMGRTNRILAGPFETQKAASDLLTKLKKADFGEAFVWTSPAGQVVDPLPVK
jgi:hypothetical protein